MRNLIVILFFIFLAGCAYTGGYWTKPDYSWEQYKSDRDDCTAIASYWNPTAGFFTPTMVRQNIPPQHTRRFGYCMEMRGYEWVQTQSEMR